VVLLDLKMFHKSGYVGGRLLEGQRAISIFVYKSGQYKY